MRASVVVQQRGLLLALLQDETAIAAVTAVGASQRLRLFTRLIEGNAVTTVTTHRVQSHAIREDLPLLLLTEMNVEKGARQRQTHMQSQAEPAKR